MKNCRIFVAELCTSQPRGRTSLLATSGALQVARLLASLVGQRTSKRGWVDGWASERAGKQSWGRAKEILDLASESLADLLLELRPDLVHDVMQKLPDVIPKLVEYMLHAVVVTQGCRPQRNDTFEVVCSSSASQGKAGRQPH